MVPVGDRELVQIVDRSLDEAVARARRPDGSSWLACRPGCTPCCHGVFRMSALDTARVQEGLRVLAAREPVRAAAVQARAQVLVTLLEPYFPGNARSGVLAEEDERWEAFADMEASDAACPALDPLTGRCEVYAHRPLTCRIFGPPVQNEFGLGVCELCYVGASEAEMLAGEMPLRHMELEEALDAEMGRAETVLAWALRPGAVEGDPRG